MKIMKKITVWLLTLAFAATMLAGCGSKTDTTDTTETTEATSADDETSDGAADTADTSENEELLTGLHHVTIDVQDYGTISLELDADTAPISVTNFINLANEGFYDGLTFHRIISGFMIQGGDPFTRDTSAAAVAKYGQGGPGYTIPAEFVPEYTHKKGALAAARRGDVANPMKESSGSQFYIVQNPETCAQLDGGYTVFGETVSGLDIIDRIAQVATDQRDKPLMDVRIKTVKLDESCLPKVEKSGTEAESEAAQE